MQEVGPAVSACVVVACRQGCCALLPGRADGALPWCLLQVSEAQAAAQEARAQLPELREQVAELTAARADLQLQVDELQGKLQVRGSA
jgi:hypothetical protein